MSSRRFSLWPVISPHFRGSQRAAVSRIRGRQVPAALAGRLGVVPGSSGRTLMELQTQGSEAKTKDASVKKIMKTSQHCTGAKKYELSLNCEEQQSSGSTVQSLLTPSSLGRRGGEGGGLQLLRSRS